MSKLNIAQSIRTFFGLGEDASDAEVHAKLQQAQDGKQKDPQPEATKKEEVKAEPPTATAEPEKAPAPEAKSDGTEKIMAALDQITARLEALESKPAAEHASGEATPQEGSKAKSWSQDPVNVQAKKIGERRISFINRKSK